MPDDLFLYVSASITIALIILSLLVPQASHVKRRR